MSRKYYCLVAGLPNISLEDSKLSYGSEDFLSDLKEFVSVNDFSYFELFRLKTDNQNIYKTLVDHEHKFIPGGVYSEDEIDEILEEPNKAVSYITEFVEEYNSEDFDEDVDNKRLTILYYRYLLRSANGIVKKWFELELNSRNILAALNSRKYGLNIEKEIIPANETAETIIKSGSRDFGLSGELDYIENLFSVFEMQDLIKREKALDIFKWEWLDRMTFFDYFTVDRLFSYYIKLVMIERWISLDPDTGKELFGRLIGDLQKTYEMPEEFQNNKF
jgi:hypothetical protein